MKRLPAIAALASLLAATGPAAADQAGGQHARQERSSMDKEALIKTLSQAKQVESRQIGEAGTVSQTWLVYDELRKQLSDAEAVALLKHKSPIVRLYMAWDIVEHRPKALSATYALVSDKARVTVMSGCEVFPGTVGESVIEAWRDASAPEARALAQKAAADQGLAEDVRRSAGQLAAAPQPSPQVRDIVMGFMKSERLNAEDFEIQQEVPSASQPPEQVIIMLAWKNRQPVFPGGDGHSRMLVIDLKQEKIIKVLWPQ